MTICILGRQPALGLAELESLYGAEAVQPVGTTAALVDAEIDFARLGGTVKAAKHLTTLDTIKADKLFRYCEKELPKHLEYIPEGKLKLGVSLYGITLPVAKQNAFALSLKKVIKNSGRSVRVVPNTEPALSSAQTLHNQLTGELGMELVFVRSGDKTLLGQVTHVQDIDAYRKRDQERPKRDSYVGMLPPKLAQIIINLAAATAPTYYEGGFSAKPASSPEIVSPVVLDPFCGTGVILQEASLMGFGMYGTDISEKMVRYTRENISAIGRRDENAYNYRLEVADATDHTWLKPIDIVACEGYLGHPFANEPGKEALMETIQTSNTIMKKFLQNIASQLEPGTRLCIAAPAWQVRGQIYHLPTLDDLEKIGYNRIDFVHADKRDLIYRRKDQVVGRELVVLTKE